MALSSDALLELAAARARMPDAGPAIDPGFIRQSALVDMAIQPGRYEALSPIVDRLRQASRAEAEASS
ncbi:MAG: hypothetical protein ACREL7_13040 [Longimicrobiales bacterium]